ncbi:glycosyltransferase family 4 protein [Granulicella sp. dw_53]|uniref:glycosyltransferase family 4 protein n=1 Tax=Granulicella sp. dw_53 TaxID=2719792 RepID=UPI001BD49311|nr:glycosyltransferase family 4 protein [Granulicella sp. dw_53]
MVRTADRKLGRSAGQRANRLGAGLLSYSYTGYDAFEAYGRPGLLFQVHPHPTTMRRILLEELRQHPECAASLKQEWELSLPEADFSHLVREVEMASHFLAASSFTRSSLIENGASAHRITVVPYGVDLEKYRPDPARLRSNNSKLRLLFVGRINQRKGVKYLLETMRLLRTREVELVVCGRVLDDLSLFKSFMSQVQIRPSVSERDLIDAYQSADLFVFPSVGEGFGQVLLESMACGLPILSTTHTAAPDLIDDGIQGFVVQPRQPALMAERIEWALSHRNQLDDMRVIARRRAEHFTWERFRSGVANATHRYLDQTDLITRASDV